jgi:carbon-monoxide dehydrogenase large subunit
MMKVPESKVRAVTGDTGGSFGMKSPIFNETPLVLLASRLTGRPVKWISTRTEAFLSDAQARDNVTEAELALDSEGQFLALRVKTFAAIGAYLQHSMPAFVLNAGTLAGVYRTPAIHVDITAVFSNTNPMRPYRGNGRPEAAFVIERMVDLAAAEMKIDPAELRRRNYVPASAMPFKTGLTFTYDSGEFEKIWTSRSTCPTARASRRARPKPASGASCWVSAFPTPSSALARRAQKAPRFASIAPAR